MSLTNAWKAGRLNCGFYFCLFKSGVILPAYCSDNCFCEYYDKVDEVLEKCDYDTFLDLKKRNNQLEVQLKNLKANYEILKDKQ